MCIKKNSINVTPREDVVMKMVPSVDGLVNFIKEFNVNILNVLSEKLETVKEENIVVKEENAFGEEKLFKERIVSSLRIVESEKFQHVMKEKDVVLEQNVDGMELQPKFKDVDQKYTIKFVFYMQILMFVH